jgi:outer membrane lipoprotein LolB
LSGGGPFRDASLKRRARRAAAALMPLALLVGCATPPAQPPASDQLGGRLSVQVAAHANQPSRSVTASFELRGSAEQGELDLSGPLGQTVARARWSPGRAQLLTSDGERSFPDLESLAQEALGERLPLGALVDWLHARPWPGAPSQPAQAGFEQLGWRVDLARAPEGLIVATRAAPPAVTLRARLDGR